MWHTGLVAPQHVGSSWTRARTCVPCIGRWILDHCATREVQVESSWGSWGWAFVNIWPGVTPPTCPHPSKGKGARLDLGATGRDLTGTTGPPPGPEAAPQRWGHELWLFHPVPQGWNLLPQGHEQTMGSSDGQSCWLWTWTGRGMKPQLTLGMFVLPLPNQGRTNNHA